MERGHQHVFICEMFPRVSRHASAMLCLAGGLRAVVAGQEDQATVDFGVGRTRCSDFTRHPRRMHCGKGVPLCGVLALETGRGFGAYHHSEPVVHGLWPQVPPFGDSQCMSPASNDVPQGVYVCYDQAGQSFGRLVGFEGHEWRSHGMCSGAQSANDFFSQVCSLSAGPLRVMAGARAAGLDLIDTANALQRAGYCVWSTGTHQQVELSVCAGSDGRWKLADASAFEETCSAAAPVPSPPSPTSVCIHGHRGPPCSSNADCQGFLGCMRCAQSGFCTDVSVGQCLHGHHGPRCKSNAYCLGVPGCDHCARSGYCTDIPMSSSRALAVATSNITGIADASFQPSSNRTVQIVTFDIATSTNPGIGWHVDGGQWSPALVLFALSAGILVLIGAGIKLWAHQHTVDCADLETPWLSSAL